MQVLLGFRQDEDPASIRLAWIRNTLKLGELWASEALLEEARANPGLEILGPPAAITFDQDLRLVAPALPQTAAA